MKRLSKLMLMVAIAATVIFASASIAMASDFGSIKTMSAYDSITADMSYTCTTSSVNVEWEPKVTDSNIQIDSWYLLYYDTEKETFGELTEALDPDVRGYSIDNLSDGLVDTVYLGCGYTDTSTGETGYIAVAYEPVSTKYKTSSFVVNNVYASSVDFLVKDNSYADGTQIEVRKVSNGAKVATKDLKSVSSKLSVSKNVAYKFRARPYLIDGEGNTIYGAWSGYRYFDYTKADILYSSAYNGCKIKIKGVSKVSKYKIYVSTKENSGYKYTTTYTPKVGVTKTYALNKIGTSKMKNNTKYYIKIVPIINSKESDVNGFTSFTNRY